MWIMTRIRTAFRKVSSTRTSAGYFSSYVTISHTTTSPTSRKTSLSAGRIGTCNGSPIVSFILPAMLVFLWNEWPGAFGSFLVAGVARIVVLQHCTFLINSACHTIGRQPYSTKCSAGDSFFLALLTLGEGYHNYHHEFQYDYRNGVKPWQFDPTKWGVWVLSKIGLTAQLRRVPAEKIQLAEIAEQQRQLELHLTAKSVRLPARTERLLQLAQERLHQAARNWEQRKLEYMRAAEKKIEASRERISELQRDFEVAAAHLR